MNEETRLSTLTFTAWADAFTPAEVDAIVAYGDSLMPERLQLAGTVVAFPSYVLHRVSPVISGTRKSLVVWTTEPKFR